MQIKASNNNGEDSKISLIRLIYSGELYIKDTKNAPKYKLPESPIKIFEGDQLNIRNARRVPINALKKGNCIFIIRRMISIDPESNPSIPSIKLMKLIIAVPKNTKKK